MRILTLTQWFEPEATFKGLLFARALRDAGHDVEVVTGFPNYPGGRLFPGYRLKPLQREVVEDIPIVRVPLYPSHDRSPVHRIANYGSFAASAALIGSIVTKRPDVIYAYHPPLTVGLAAVALSAVKRAPFVYDIQDLWPDTLSATGMMNGRTQLRLVDATARFVYRRAARLVVQSPGFDRALRARGVPGRKIELIYNWCDERRLRPDHDPEMARELGGGDSFNVVFAGTMGKAQALDAVLEAARSLDTPGSRIRFVLVGGGVEVDHLQARARSMRLTNVRFLPRMPMDTIGRVLEAADVLLVHLKDDPLFSMTIPAKTQAYLSVGKPIVMAVRGDAADLVRRAGAGVTCDPEDPEGLAVAIAGLAAEDPAELAAMGARGRAFYRSELSLAVGVARFLEVFERVVADRHA